MDMKQVKRFVGIWFLGGIATVAILAILTGLTLKNHGWVGYLQLVRSGETCEGIITRTEPQNHCLAVYSFKIGDRSYSGDGPDCTARVGQMVSITYLASDPSHSCLGSARERLTNELMTFFVGGIIFPPFVMFVYRIQKRKSRKRKTTPNMPVDEDAR
jgi:hypothetical protein